MQMTQLTQLIDNWLNKFDGKFCSSLNFPKKLIDIEELNAAARYIQCIN